MALILTCPDCGDMIIEEDRAAHECPKKIERELNDRIRRIVREELRKVVIRGA